MQPLANVREIKQTKKRGLIMEFIYLAIYVWKLVLEKKMKKMTSSSSF